MKKRIAIPCFFALVALLFFSLFRYQALVEEEREFANYLLIREGGMYTFVGSKPISEFSVEKHLLTPEEKLPKEGCPVQYFSTEEVESTEDNHFDLDAVAALWRGWQRRHKVNSQKYALITVVRKERDWVYFVNKALVKETLLQYYPLFVKQVGFEFDIEEIMAKIDDPRSFFWQKFLPMDKLNHVAAGIFFGYGLENAVCFDEAQKDAEPTSSMFSASLAERMRAVWKKKVSLKELPLPTFRIFSTTDNQVELYKKEREQIRRDYEGKDLRQLLIVAFK